MKNQSRREFFFFLLSSKGKADLHGWRVVDGCG